MSARFGSILVAIVALLAVVGLWFRGTESATDGARELVILHAGSLAVPFREVSAEFMRMYPDVTALAEAAGSRDTARKVSDLGRRCDVLGSADYAVIETLLIPAHTNFCIRFASNEMVIAYTEHSREAETITAETWPQVLLSDGVAFGRSDPNRDPCGYRTVMVFQLAEKHYGIPGLAGELESKHGRKYIRPKETDLLALLEAGEIDYLFIYRSVASQHRLRFIELPDEVNLKSAALGEWYAQARVELTGKRPGEFIERRGAPMVYGVTIPHDAPQRELAEAWVRLLLSEAGRRIMERNGQPVLAPALSAQYEQLPATLKPLCAATSDGE